MEAFNFMILALGHKAGVGKSAACEYLARTYSFLSDAFAFSLKESVKIKFGWTDDDLKFKKEIVDPFWGISPRRACQLEGTEAGRNVFGEDVWIKTLKKRMTLNPTRNYAISDLRFPNEAEFVKKQGGLVIRLDRDIVGTEEEHVSETALDGYTGWDMVLENNFEIERLWAALDLIVSKHVLAEKKEKKPRGKKKKVALD